MAKRKRVAKNEFRYNYATQHTNYIFEEENGKYHGVGLTTKPTTFGKKNMPLNINTKRGEKQKSYVRNGIVTNKISEYSGVDKRFSFKNIFDFLNIKAIIRNYKNNRRKRKKKK